MSEKPWMTFALPAVFVTVIIAAFLIGGPVAGFAVAALVAVAVVAVAIRMTPGDRRPAGQEWLGAAARRMPAPLVLAVAGAVLVIATAGTARIIGWGLLAVAGVLALSFVFLEIGYSEDRDRTRSSSSAR